MRLKFSLLLIGIVLFQSLIAKKVETTKAKNIAKNFYYERVQQFKPVKYHQLFLYKSEQNSQKENPSFYIFNVGQNDGFVLVSADDAVVPVLGYSFSGTMDLEKIPPALDFVLENYKNQIQNTVERQIQANSSIQQM